MAKEHEVGGFAGCVELRKRKNGVVVGVYNAEQAGLESDEPSCKWMTVCESHHYLVGHATLKLALYHAVTPEEWCDECMKPKSEDGAENESAA